MADEQAETPEQSESADSAGGELRPRGGGRWATALSLVALFSVAAGLAAGYVCWIQVRDALDRLDTAVQRAEADQARLTAGLEAIRSDFEHQRADLEAGKQRLAETQAELQKRESDMRAALDGVYQRLGRKAEDWKAAEAEYLLLIANHRLRLMRDRKTAVAALQAADERLRDTGDPSWLPVRDAIASELAALRAVDLPDLPGVAARIAALIDQAGHLRLRGAAPPRPGPAGSAAAKPPTAARAGGSERPTPDQGHSVESLLRDSLKGLQSVLEIRRHDRPVVAMLPPDQQYFVLENLRLQLQAARLGALEAGPDLYRSSLQTAQTWLGDLFDPGDPATRAMQDELTQLQGIDVRPALPDISGSLKRLRERRKAPAEGPEKP